MDAYICNLLNSAISNSLSWITACNSEEFEGNGCDLIEDTVLHRIFPAVAEESYENFSQNVSWLKFCLIKEP